MAQEIDGRVLENTSGEPLASAELRFHKAGARANWLQTWRWNPADTSQTLPPGKYYVVATEEPVDPTPESIGRLWRSRNRFQEVDLPPAGAAQVRLQPGKIE